MPQAVKEESQIDWGQARVRLADRLSLRPAADGVRAARGGRGAVGRTGPWPQGQGKFYMFASVFRDVSI